MYGWIIINKYTNCVVKYNSIKGPNFEKNYELGSVENDIELEHFSIQEDKDDLIPMIKDAMKISRQEK